MSKSAEFQLAHDKQMFDYQNAYNDPSAVLARNMAAGLNPAAVLGQSGVGVSATIPTSSGGAPSGHGPVASGPGYRDWETDRKSTRLNSSHITRSRIPSSA